MTIPTKRGRRHSLRPPITSEFLSEFLSEFRAAMCGVQETFGAVDSSFSLSCGVCAGLEPSRREEALSDEDGGSASEDNTSRAERPKPREREAAFGVEGSDR